MQIAQEPTFFFMIYKYYATRSLSILVLLIFDSA